MCTVVFFSGAHVNAVVGQWSPLHWTAWHGNVKVSNLLLEKGEFTFLILILLSHYGLC